MSDLRVTGKATLLTAPVELDGRTFTHAVSLLTWPDVPGDDRLITSGTFDVDTATGASDEKPVICRRGPRSSSYVGVGSPPPDVPFTYLAGGNVVAASEAWSHAWHNSGDVHGGGRTAQRAQRGDVLVWQGRHFLITDCEAYASAPATVEWQEGESPGRCPIMQGTRNVATPESTDLDENQLNWRDLIVVADPRGELEAAEGDTFEIRRRPVFHPLHPPQVQFAVRGTAWATLPPEAYYLLAEEGIILLEQDWMAAFASSDRLCFRFAGKRFRQTGTLPARAYNDLTGLLEGADNVWVSTPIGASTTTGIGGWIDWGAAYGDAECVPDPSADPPYSTTTLKLKDLCFGNSWNFWLANGIPTMAFGTVFPPYWLGSPAGFVEPVLIPEDRSGPIECGDGSYDRGDLNTEWAGVAFVRNWETLGDPLFGRYNWIVSQLNLGGGWSCNGRFSFGAVPWDPAGLLQAIPKGSEIIEATARIKMGGLVSWTEEIAAGFDVPAGTTHERRTVNGVLVLDVATGGMDDPSFDLAATDYPAYLAAQEPVPGGPVRWALMGVRRNSADELDVNGEPVEDIPSHRYGQLGVSVSEEFGDDQWTIIDVTTAISRLVVERETNWSSFLWWPQRGGISPGASSEGLAAYVDDLKPDVIVSGTYAFGGATNFREVSGVTKKIAWDALEFDVIVVRFRLPSGVLDSQAFPIIRPPAMPAPP